MEQLALGARIKATLLAYWDRPAFTEYGDASETFGQVAARIVCIHRQLKALGVVPGDRVALVGRSSVGWVATYFAIISYGAVVVPILNDFKGPSVTHIVSHSGASVFYLTESHWKAINDAALSDVIAFIDLHSGRFFSSVKPEAFIQPDAFPPITKQDFAHWPVSTLSGDALAEINYTSGTTGFSKGVMQPYRALESNLEFAAGAIHVGNGDPVISLLPLAHVYAQAFEFLYCFLCGCHIHFISKTLSPKVIAQAFTEIKPRIILIVPLILEKIYKQHILRQLNRRGMRLLMRMPIIEKRVKKKFCDALTQFFGENFIEIIVGGAALNPEVELFLKRIGFRYTVGYGMTECAPIIAYSGWQDHRLGSTGKAVVNMKIRIASADPHTGIGEVQVKGKNLMLGYYRDEGMTAEVFTPEGWMKTGDLGYLDEQGYLFIKGRSKNMILGASGQNIYPEEVEAVLNSQPYIQKSLVIEEKGLLVALVVPDFAVADRDDLRSSDMEMKFEEVRRLVNTELPQYCQIASIRLYPEEFEKTPKKSIKRFLYAHGATKR